MKITINDQEFELTILPKQPTPIWADEDDYVKNRKIRLKGYHAPNIDYDGVFDIDNPPQNEGTYPWD